MQFLREQRSERPHLKLRWWAPVRGVLCTQVSGRIDLTGALCLENAFEQTLQASGTRLRVFHDWAQVTGYETEARIHYTDWSKPLMPQVLSIHILFESRLVAMGLSVANLVLGNKLHATSDRRHFEQLRSQATGDEITRSGG